jgi:hypothetical protein
MSFYLRQTCKTGRIPTCGSCPAFNRTEEMKLPLRIRRLTMHDIYKSMKQ